MGDVADDGGFRHGRSGGCAGGSVRRFREILWVEVIINTVDCRRWAPGVWGCGGVFGRSKSGKQAIAVGCCVTAGGEARYYGAIRAIAAEAFWLCEVLEGDFLSNVGGNHGEFCREMFVEPGTDIGVMSSRG